MAGSIKMSGEHAAVYWGYHQAADVGHWSLEYGVIRATLRRANAFQLTQAPLWFTIDNSAAGRPNFVRQLLDVTITGDVLSARLGPRKS